MYCYTSEATQNKRSTLVIWLEYCRYGVKHYPINQSINQSINHSLYPITLITEFYIVKN